MRFLAVSFPHWPITAAGCSPSVSAAVIESGRVQHYSPAAYRDGVRTGQRRREAKGHSPELITLAPNPHLDAQQFEPIVATLIQVVPRLELTKPGLCTLAATGPARYYGGEVGLIDELRCALEELGAQSLDTKHEAREISGARIGIADSRFGAQLAAEHGTDGYLVAPGRTREFLADLPISTLELDELSTIAHRLGIETLGQFAQLPTRSVLTRFGSAAATAHALARGLDPTPLAIHQPAVELAVSSELDPPAQRVDIASFAAKRLSAELIEILDRHGLACTQLRIEAATEHGEELCRIWRASPVFDAETIVERVRWQLSGWLDSTDPALAKPTAGVSLLRLIADEVAGANDLQISLWGELSQADRRAVRGLDRVSGLLGPAAVFTALISGGRSPADRVQLVPWGQPPPSIDPPMPWPGHVPEPMPSVIHPDPIPIEVHGVQGPVRVTSRGEISGSPTQLRQPGGNWAPVIAWAGPWLVDEHWWEPDTAQRVARFQLTTKAEVAEQSRAPVDVAAGASHAYLCCVQQNSWWIEATYD